VFVCLRVCVCACVRACVRVRVRACDCLFMGVSQAGIACWTLRVREAALNRQHTFGARRNHPRVE
jgi:hypothetical protein